MKYIYPASFTREKGGAYSVDFPDIEGCYTCGDDLADSMEMAKDVLAMTLSSYETRGESIPSPSRVESLKVKKTEFANYIACDTSEYRKRHNGKSVRRNVALPEWLNEMASRANLNVSQILQEALIKKLGV